MLSQTLPQKNKVSPSPARPLEEPLVKGHLSLYLHIPFCRHRCSYCDFNTYTSLGDLKEAYGVALGKEIAQVGEAAASHPSPGSGKRPVHTVFFGGGTPSLMSPESLGAILDVVRDSFRLSQKAEITLEANPGTVDFSYMKAVCDLGVNRLSLGVQSAIPAELALLERRHNFRAVTEVVAWCADVGLTNLSLDLIYGVPGQTLPSWERSLQAALGLSPKHLSLYCLTIEPGTPIQRRLKNGQVKPPDPDLAADMYALACDLLAAAGFQHYEISNWALPGFECRHNLTYWRNQPYLGLGAGAHGYAGGYRYRVVKQPRVYIRRMQTPAGYPFPLSAAVAEKHRLSRQEAMSDTVITQLRLLKEGLDLEAFHAQFGQTLDEAYQGTVSQLVEWGLLRQEDGWLRLTEKARFLSNQVFYRFM